MCYVSVFIGCIITHIGADARFLKRESNLLGLHAKGGSGFGSNVKKSTSWGKKGGVQTPGAPGSAPDI